MTELQEPTFAPEAGVGKSDEGQSHQEEYFGFEATEKFYFPDKSTWIEFKKFNEGDKKKFQDKVSRDLVLKRSGDASMRVLQGSERHELIRTAAKDWNLKRNGVTAPFNQINLGDFLALSDPLIVEDLEKAIRKANPWLMADMKSEDIEREIENLQEMLEVAKKREAGEVS